MRPLKFLKDLLVEGFKDSLKWKCDKLFCWLYVCHINMKMWQNELNA